MATSKDVDVSGVEVLTNTRKVNDCIALEAFQHSKIFSNNSVRIVKGLLPSKSMLLTLIIFCISSLLCRVFVM